MNQKQHDDGDQEAFSAISSSASTTIFGFLALIFMRFGIGADLGIVMAKLFSPLSVSWYLCHV